MAPPLRLTLTDYLDPTRWRWLLCDSQDRFLADHTVQLDPTRREYAGFLDLRGYLDYHQPIHPPAAQLADLGAWMGEQVFGGLRPALLEQQRRAASTWRCRPSSRPRPPICCSAPSSWPAWPTGAVFSTPGCAWSTSLRGPRRRAGGATARPGRSQPPGPGHPARRGRRAGSCPARLKR